MSITNSTFAELNEAEFNILNVAHNLQAKADTAIDKAFSGWEKVVGVLSERGIKMDYLRSPTGNLGPIDGRHVDVYNFVRDVMLLPINAQDPQGILEFIRDEDKARKAEAVFTVLCNGKMQECTRTKQQWQSFVRDLPKNLYNKVKRAEPKKTGANKTTSDQFTLLGAKIDAAIKHCKKLNPEKDQSIADLDIVSILLGLETAKNHLTQK